MNYVILNGTKSNTIKGLLIQALPPVSKPLMRTEIQQIDGRDGDIVTKLGYAAYDKEMRIGLFGDFAIDDVISFFDSDGTVTFSNEPDKYYNYQIIEQIDFERLIRFREATVTFHVQPFKYSAVEGVMLSRNLLNALNIVGNTTGNEYVTLEQGDGSIQITVNTAFSAGVFVGSIWMRGLTVGQKYTLSATSAQTGFTSAYIYTDKLYGTRITSGTLTNGITFTAPQESVLIGFYATNRTAGEVLTIQGLQFGPGSKKQNYMPYNTVYVTNSGNTTAKPTVTLQGSGAIDVILNGNQVLTVSLGDNEQITIDAAAMNAYNGDVLMNRSVTGDYSDLALNVGANTIYCDGGPTMIQVENFSRWI